MRKWLLLAALLLPAVWLGAGIWQQERTLATAGEWRIPITGYDPRDPIRGQYVQFTYAWQLRGDQTLCTTEAACNLCLSREGETVIATVQAAPAACPSRVDPAASQLAIRPPILDSPLQFGSRIFVSEASAPELEARLRESPMVVVAALSPEGRLINRRIEPSAPRTQP